VWDALVATYEGHLIYRRTDSLRTVQLLLGHTKIESTVRYLGIEVDDALAMAEQVDV
jgi:site-specific recombinase XerC